MGCSYSHNYSDHSGCADPNGMRQSGASIQFKEDEAMKVGWRGAMAGRTRRRKSPECSLGAAPPGVRQRRFPGGAAPGLHSGGSTALGPPPEGPRVTFTQTIALISTVLSGASDASGDAAADQRIRCDHRI